MKTLITSAIVGLIDRCSVKNIKLQAAVNLSDFQYEKRYCGKEENGEQRAAS